MAAKSDPAKSDNVRAVDRAIDVLECFATERSALSIGDIERRAKLSRPTLYRILATLIRRNLVRRDGDPPRYRLDIGAARLADAWSHSIDVVQLATPLMKDLLDRYDETVALYVRKDDERLCLAELPSRQALSFGRGLGDSGGLTRGASGLAILAFVNDGDAARMIAKERGAARARALRRSVTEIRRSGYAVSSGAFIAGAHAIAAPVFDRSGSVVGSLGLFGPAVRFPPKRIAECARAIKDAAARLSSHLGYHPTAPAPAIPRQAAV